jgi:hypothetical protein
LAASALATDRAASGSDPAALHADTLAAINAEANAQSPLQPAHRAWISASPTSMLALDLWQSYLLDPQHPDAPPGWSSSSAPRSRAIRPRSRPSSASRRRAPKPRHGNTAARTWTPSPGRHEIVVTDEAGHGGTPDAAREARLELSGARDLASDAMRECRRSGAARADC